MGTDEANKAVEKVNQSLNDFGVAALKGWAKACEEFTNISPLLFQMGMCEAFAEDRGFKIELETKSRGYRIKLRLWHWFKIPISMWSELRRGGHSMKDAVRITDELRCYL